MHIQNNTTRAT